MQITVPREEFLDALSAVVQGNKPGLLTVTGARLTLQTFNGDLYLRSQVEACPGTLPVSGSCGLASLSHLRDVVRTTASASVVMRFSNFKLHIECDRAQFALITQEVDLLIPSLTGKPTVFPAGEFQTHLKEVAHAVCTDETRSGMGLHIEHPEAGIARMVATDGSRLAYSDLPHEGEPLVLRKSTLRASLVGTLRRLPTDGSVSLLADTGWISIDCGNVYMAARLLDGEFPSYRTVLPRGAAPVKITCSVEPLLEAVRRVRMEANDRCSTVGIVPIEGGLRIRTYGSLGNEAHEDVRCDVSSTVEGEWVVAFNGYHLADALGVIPTTDVQFNIYGPLAPCSLLPVGREGHLQIVMPIRVEK